MPNPYTRAGLIRLIIMYQEEKYMQTRPATKVKDRQIALRSVVTATDVIKMYPELSPRTVYRRLDELKRYRKVGKLVTLYHIDDVIELMKERKNGE